MKEEESKKKTILPDNFTLFRDAVIAVLFSRDFLLLSAVLFVVAVFVWAFLWVLAPFLVAGILAYILEPAVRAMMRWFRLSRPIAVPLLFVLGILGVLLFVVPFSIQIVTNVNSMAQEISKVEYRPLIRKWTTQVKTWGDEYLPDSVKENLDSPHSALEAYEEKINNAVGTVNQYAGRALKLIGGWLISVSNFTVKRTMDIFLIPVLAFYFLLDFERIYPLFLSLIPGGYRSWTHAFMEACDSTLRNFLFGQVIVAFVFGSLMTLGLMLIGIKFSLVIGPLAGVANMIPYLGGLISLLPVVGLAIYQGAADGSILWMLGLVAIHFSTIQLIDGFILQPKIIGGNVELHPLVVMLALFIGGEVGGIYGMIVAVPTAAILKVLGQELYSVLYLRQSILLKEPVILPDQL